MHIHHITNHWDRLAQAWHDPGYVPLGSPRHPPGGVSGLITASLTTTGGWWCPSSWLPNRPPPASTGCQVAAHPSRFWTGSTSRYMTCRRRWCPISTSSRSALRPVQRQTGSRPTCRILISHQQRSIRPGLAHARPGLRVAAPMSPPYYRSSIRVSICV